MDFCSACGSWMHDRTLSLMVPVGDVRPSCCRRVVLSSPQQPQPQPQPPRESVAGVAVVVAREQEWV